MNKTAKYIDIELDKPRRLLFDLNAMAAYEKETGDNFLDLPKKAVSATLLRVVLWAGLIHEDKALTIDQVGAMLDPENMVSVQEKIVKAVSVNSPEVPEKQEGEPDPNALKPEAQI
jgi:hypothetical protein